MLPELLSIGIKDLIPEFSNLCSFFVCRTALQSIFTDKTLGIVSKIHRLTLTAFLSPSGFL